MEKEAGRVRFPGTSSAGHTFFENRLLKYSEAAEFLSMSESYLRRLKARGEVPCVSIGSRGIRFSVASLSRWVEKREMK